MRYLDPLVFGIADEKDIVPGDRHCERDVEVPVALPLHANDSQLLSVGRVQAHSIVSYGNLKPLETLCF